MIVCSRATPNSTKCKRVVLRFSGVCNMFCTVNVAAALWPNAKESLRNWMISALRFKVSGPLPSFNPSGSFVPSERRPHEVIGSGNVLDLDGKCAYALVLAGRDVPAFPEKS